MAFSILVSRGISPWLLNMCENPASLSVSVVKNHEFIVTHVVLNQEADSILEGPGRWACREQHGQWEKRSPLSWAWARPRWGSLGQLPWALTYHTCTDFPNAPGNQWSLGAQEKLFCWYHTPHPCCGPHCTSLTPPHSCVEAVTSTTSACDCV